ncbi:low-temperature-induced 65 kDa protein-like [Telopea speciosissima]|uniref:low-temperature-induced 65 kDa protein-like n=1 Tax=Telopea speciosissima TaxID=54955 RepID=UPI001CC7D860|nr:low-temperature-induced 65 kDa protein-like [Telopea speciosissima]
MDTQRLPVHRHSHEEDPQNAGLHTVIHEEDGHDKSVLKKVKAKAKKLKDTIMHGHGHGHGHDHEHDEEEEEDGEEMEQDPEVHGPPAAARGVLAPHEDKSGQSRAGLGTTPQLAHLEKDPQAPKDRLESSDPGNYQTKVTDPAGPGGKEARVTPLISSFGKMEVLEEPGEHKPWSSSTGSHDQFSPDLPPTETKTIGVNTQAVPKSLNENETDNQSQASKVQEQPNQSRAEGGEANKSATLGERGRLVAATVTEKLAPVYEKVAEAGSAVVSKVQGTGTGKEREGERVGGAGKGVSVKKYVAEKLRPSEGDKALSEVISDALHKRKGKESQAMGKVTESPEVARRLGSDRKDDAPEGFSSSNEVGKGMVERFKGTVNSWLGKNGEQQQHQPTSQGLQSSSPVDDEVRQDNAGERKLNESTN